MCRAEESVARMRDCGDRAWTSVGASMPPLFLSHVRHVSIRSTASAYGSKGTAILAVTWPVAESATLTIPSVPAEYNDVPSKL